MNCGAASHGECDLGRKDAFAVAKDDEIRETLKCFCPGSDGWKFVLVTDALARHVRATRRGRAVRGWAFSLSVAVQLRSWSWFGDAGSDRSGEQRRSRQSHLK